MRKHSKHHVTANIAQQLELPRDLMFGDTVVTILGRTEMTLENYGGILSFSEQQIRLALKNGEISVTGNALHIVYYTNDEMKIHGRIDRVEYQM